MNAGAGAGAVSVALLLARKAVGLCSMVSHMMGGGSLGRGSATSHSLASVMYPRALMEIERLIKRTTRPVAE